MDIDRLNISNLTALWEEAVKEKGQLVKGNDYKYGLFAASEWPNRLWFDRDVDTHLLSSATALIKTVWPFVVPYWDVYQNPESHELFRECGYELKSEQFGMSLDLSGKRWDPISDIRFEKVDDMEQANRWSESFTSAFRYHISKELLTVSDHIQVLLIYSAEKLIGTLMMFSCDPRVMGLHSMGIHPDLQRRGYGEKVMRQALHYLQSDGYEWVTLQASKAGWDLYKKLGFEQRFHMRNYVLTQH